MSGGHGFDEWDKLSSRSQKSHFGGSGNHLELPLSHLLRAPFRRHAGSTGAAFMSGGQGFDEWDKLSSRSRKSHFGGSENQLELLLSHLIHRTPTAIVHAEPPANDAGTRLA